MTREHLTRAQRREQTREHLLSAAREIFAKKGLAATSVEDITEAAGYTRGAYYSNFDDKSELLLELLRRDHDCAQANLRAIMEEGGTREQMKARAIAYYSRHLRDHDCFLLRAEAMLLASRDPRFRDRFNTFRHEELDQVSTCIRAFSESGGSSLPLNADAIARGLVSLCDGVKFSRMFDPQAMSESVMQAVLAGFFSSALWRQTEDLPDARHRAGNRD